MKLNLNKELLKLLDLDELKLRWLVKQSSSERNSMKRECRKKILEKAGKKCQVCGFNDVVEVHHITSIKTGGIDEISNLSVLCPNHHRMVHMTNFRDELQQVIKDGKQ